MDIFLKVFLKSSAGEVELSTYDQDAPYRILDGARGFGLPQRSIESSPIASGNGSSLRSQRFDETEMMLPISIRGANASDVAEKARRLERVLMPASNEPIEVRVVAPQLSTTRRRFIYYMGGLEGSIGGQDSHFTWRKSNISFMALDPMWYGEEVVSPQRVLEARKPFITSRVGKDEVNPKRVPFLPIILSSTTVEGEYKLNIGGDANTWPIWEVIGPGQDLLIEDAETGKNIFIEGEFNEPVIIDTRPTVSDIYSETDDDGELWDRVDDDYQLFPLTPGKNRIKITMVNARPNSRVVLRYSETWLAGW